MADFQKTTVSTNSLSFFNEEKVLLKLTYLEDALTISINYPEVTDGKAKYPQNLRHQALLNQNNVVALHRLTIEHVIPAFAEGRNKDVGVFANRNKTQMVETYTQGGSFFVVIHDEIENRIPKNSYVFKFDKTPVIQDYDIGAVSFKTEEVDAQFFLFIKALEAFENLSNGITAHEYRYRNSWFNDHVRKYLEALNLKLGLGMQTYQPNNNYDAKSGFESGNSYNPNSAAGAVIQVHQGSMNDLFPGAGDELPFH